MYTKEIKNHEQIYNLIENYQNAGGDVITLNDGVLGFGVVAFVNNGLKLKEFILEEYYINPWASGHRLKIYPHGGLPKKYLKMIDKVLEGEGA